MVYAMRRILMRAAELAHGRDAHATRPVHDVVLKVENLRVAFTSRLGRKVEVVRGSSFELKRGRTLALVGESGSGKSVTSYSILRLIQKPGEITGGKILFSPQSGES